MPSISDLKGANIILVPNITELRLSDDGAKVLQDRTRTEHKEDEVFTLTSQKGEHYYFRNETGSTTYVGYQDNVFKTPGSERR